MNLCLIPKIDSKAYYVSNGDLVHTYDNINFFFDFEDDLPNDLQISTTVLDQIIQAEIGFDSMRLAGHGMIISSATNFAADWYSLLFNGYLSASQTIRDLFINENDSYCMKWTVSYNGEVSSNRYSWTFDCPLGSQDVILGSDGLLPHPSDHTYTSHGDVISDLVDDQTDNGYVYIPSGNPPSYSGFTPPHIEGKTLYFYIQDTELVECTIDDFSDCFIQLNHYNDYCRVRFLSPLHDITGTKSSAFFNYSHGTGGYTTLTSPYYTLTDGTCYVVTFWQNNRNNRASFILPGFDRGSNDFNSSVVMPYSTLGYSSEVAIPGTSNFFLRGVRFDTVTNPDDIVIPIDEPVPAQPGIDWPSENLPDNDPDGDPIQVDPFDPEPINPVVPLPPIPTIISGNDDLWPDLNDVFEREDDALGFVSLALDWEWPDFSEFLGDYVTSFQWVAAIITALYSGSDLSILFSVLSFFFIAAGMLGIYKWWNK